MAGLDLASQMRMTDEDDFELPTFLPLSVCEVLDLQVWTQCPVYVVLGSTQDLLVLGKFLQTKPYPSPKDSVQPCLVDLLVLIISTAELYLMLG